MGLGEETSDLGSAGGSPGRDEEALVERLLGEGRLSPEDVSRCRAAQRALGGPARVGLAQLLVERGVLAADAAPCTPRVAPDRPARLSPGSRIGRYVVREQVGSGGMGVVFRAFDEVLQRDVAVKLLLTQPSERSRQRFLREARALAALRHPSIVAVHEADIQGGQPFLVMDLVEGESVESLLQRGACGPERLVALLRDVALALDHAHQAGLIHRDVKPDNMVVDPSGRVILLDFGLAVDPEEQLRLTASGAVLGTPAYMSPEQGRGDRSATGPWTDVYALGAVLYRGLTGRSPIVAETIPEFLVRLQRTPPTPPSQLAPATPPALEAIALRCLAKDPARRYGSAGELARELQRYLARGRRPPWGPVRRRWPAWAAAGLAALLALAGVRSALLSGGQAATDEPAAAGGSALAGAPTSGTAAPDAARRMVDRATEHHARGEHALAIALLTSALELDPGAAWTWALRAEVRMDASDHEGALADAERAMELAPMVLLEKGQVGLPSARANALGVRAHSLLCLGRWAESFSDRLLLSEYYPDHTANWLGRANARRERDLGGARADYQRFLRLAPPDDLPAPQIRAWLAEPQETPEPETLPAAIFAKLCSESA